jgi:hypothetical protein
MVDAVIVAPEIVAKLKAEKVMISRVSPALRADREPIVAPSVAV